ncbi:hypothetical protein E4U41_002696 [Claviceps citrina]|nr:hypothetical protein E4U41_002696 [Claviceps citrina]
MAKWRKEQLLADTGDVSQIFPPDNRSEWADGRRHPAIWEASSDGSEWRRRVGRSGSALCNPDQQPRCQRDVDEMPMLCQRDANEMLMDKSEEVADIFLARVAPIQYAVSPSPPPDSHQVGPSSFMYRSSPTARNSSLSKLLLRSLDDHDRAPTRTRPWVMARL